MLLLTNKTIEKLKYDLVREKLIDFDVLQVAQKNSEKNSTTLSEELVAAGFITEKELLAFIEERLHIPFVELSDYAPDKNCLQYISVENAKKFNIFPLFRIEDVLTIAMSDPLDLFTINTLFEMNEVSIEPIIASEKAIKAAIEQYYLGVDIDSSVDNWQELLISDNLSDELLRKSITGILDEAIRNSVSQVCFERSSQGVSLFFDKELKANIPLIIVPRFFFELKAIANLDTENEDVPQNSKFVYSFQNNDYSIYSSIFPAKFLQRISLLINQPIIPLANYGIDIKKLDTIFEQPALIAINYKAEIANSTFDYSLAEYLSTKKSVLMVENSSKYQINNIVQVEMNKNVGIYFDEIIKQIDFQNFEVIFWKQVCSKEQLSTLKLLSKNKIVVLSNCFADLKEQADYIINTNGIIE